MLVLLLLTVLGAGALGLIRRKAETALHAAQENRYVSYLLADELRQSSDDLTRLARTYVVTGDERWEKQYFEILDIRSGKLPRPQNYHQIYWDFRAAGESVPPASGEKADLLDLMKRAGMTEEELGKLAQARANSDGLVTTETIALNMVKGLYDDGKGNFTVRGEPDLERARTMMHDAQYHANKAKIMKPVNEFLALLDQRTQREVAAASALVTQWTAIFWAFGLLMFGLCALMLVMSFRSVLQGLSKAQGVADAVATGNLTVPMPASTPNEIGDLMRSLGKMKESLLHTVLQVRSASDSIGTASQQIASGNQDLSGRTEQAASSLQETAASMEQLNSTVRQSADSARQANQLARTASEVAVRGGQVVGEVVSTMDEIQRSSQKINDIIGVIDGIAFQTNILALNAAVEAARAGEQGRGFAVVAGEVRNLAQRSAEAAKEIKGLIGASVNRVAQGSRLVADAGQTMEDIVGSIQRVSDIVGEITAAAGEQSDGIGQVNVAVNQLDQMTQQNAALVEESAAAAESLKEQAARLAQTVSVFQVGAQAAAHRSAAPLASYEAPAPKAMSQKPAAPKLSAPARTTAPKAAPAPAAPQRISAQPSGGASDEWESF